uniref:Uncharacterized protein n=1 Tax=Meloidogyne enterolobii TaxID=390850 RepID=A0A6V7VXF5_MELEN|nr:unnamed protein product [Meloidogyne enterolobii]CAD2179621.1 unnamed protein product [Meloidogyne enterolobii]
MMKEIMRMWRINENAINGYTNKQREIHNFSKNILFFKNWHKWFLYDGKYFMMGKMVKQKK